MIFLSGRPEMFFCSVGLDPWSVSDEMFPHWPENKSEKKRNTRNAAWRQFWNKKKRFHQGRARFFGHLNVTWLTVIAGGKKRQNFFPEMSRVRRQLSSSIIGLRWTKQVDKEISLTSLLTKAVSAPAGRFEVNYQLQDFVCPQLLTSRRRTEKNVVIWEIRTARSHLHLWPGVWVDREGH